MRNYKAQTGVNSATKPLTKLTFVGFLFVLASLLGCLAQAVSYSKTLPEAQALADVALAKIRSEGKPYHIAAYSPGDRDITYCSENCACMALQFAPLFKARGFDVRTIYLRQSPTRSGFRIKGAPDGFAGPQYFNYHYATAVRIGNDWYVLDPIAISSGRFERLKIWKKRLVDPVIFQIQR